MAVIRVAAGLLLIASVTINFANIIGRYFLSVSLPWAEEAMLFLMIGCVFLGAGPVGWAGRHTSDRLVNAVVAHGNPAGIDVKVREHLDAGADHVALLLPPGGDFATGIDQLEQVSLAYPA